MFKILIALFFLTSFVVAQEETYPDDPAGKKREGVPQGTVTNHVFDASEIYPGTTREYFIYKPAQYVEGTPAALMVFQDGKGYLKNVPRVFDNLIHDGDMPVTIGVFVNPGIVPALNETAQPRFNRSFEYDAADDRYPRFLIEEFLPVALKGLSVTDDPNLRAICGSSSGGIAAFNAAWHRPDQFRRVYTTVGTYVGLRGGNELPVLVRKMEPKPLRIFLQDGSKDNNLYCGSWWVANQDMLASLQWAGYEVNHEWGKGGHNRKHGNAIFSKVMHWLWEGWDKDPVIRNHPDKAAGRRLEFFEEGAGWELVSEGHGFTEGPAVNAAGDFFFSDLEKSEIWRVNGTGKVSLFQKNTGGTNGLAIAPDGKTLYGCQREPGRLVSWNIDSGEMSVHAENVKPNDVVVAHDGTVYFSEPRSKSIWVISPGKKAKVAAKGYSGVNGVVLSTDQTLVYVADYGGRFVWSGQRKPDGTLAFVQPFYHLNIAPGSVDVRSQADGMAVDKDGWLLVATAMGVQVCDPPGRVHLIVPPPIGERHPSNVALQGNVLYATCGGKVFKRQVRLTGAQPWDNPVKPPKPQL